MNGSLGDQGFTSGSVAKSTVRGADPPMPNIEEIFGNLLQNDAVKGIINNMVNSLNGAGSIEDALKEVTSIVSDPKIKEAIVSTSIETASQAKNVEAPPESDEKISV